MSLGGNSSLVEPKFDNPPHNPMVMFKNWIEMAEHLNVSEPKGVSLSTINSYGHPSS